VQHSRMLSTDSTPRLTVFEYFAFLLSKSFTGPLCKLKTLCCRYDGNTGRNDLDTAHPVILGDGEPVATHLTTVEAAIRASAAEKVALKQTPMRIGPVKVPPKPKPDTPTLVELQSPPKDQPVESIDADAAAGVATTVSTVTTVPMKQSSATGDSSTALIASGEATVKTDVSSYATGWKYSDVLTRGHHKQQQSALSLQERELAAIEDLTSSIPDGRLGACMLSTEPLLLPHTLSSPTNCFCHLLQLIQKLQWQEVPAISCTFSSHAAFCLYILVVHVPKFLCGLMLSCMVWCDEQALRLRLTEAH
jgi:hypothetical protein